MRHNGSQPAPTIRLRSISRQYIAHSAVLDHTNLDIYPGEFVALLGVSGSGKSTLLNLISGVDAPDSGTVTINGTEITALSEHDRTLFRRDRIGIVFQFFNLIPTLTVLENITLPLDLRGANRRQSQQRGRALLARVGLLDRATEFPDRLSGGEQQRVAIARALVHEPAVVLADEPTGNLDGGTGKMILALLLELTRDAGRTLVMATHDTNIAALADRVIRIEGGKLVIAQRARPTIAQPGS